MNSEAARKCPSLLGFRRYHTGRAIRFCRPLRNHSATWPHEAGSIYSIKYLGNRLQLLRLVILKSKTALILK
jgi:hypothetical protein